MLLARLETASGILWLPRIALYALDVQRASWIHLSMSAIDETLVEKVENCGLPSILPRGKCGGN
jgi:hypothetical protein